MAKAGRPPKDPAPEPASSLWDAPPVRDDASWLCMLAAGSEPGLVCLRVKGNYFTSDSLRWFEKPALELSPQSACHYLRELGIGAISLRCGTPEELTERLHKLGCDEAHQHRAPKCCDSKCWCRALEGRGA